MQAKDVRSLAVRDLLRIELGNAYISKVSLRRKDSLTARRVTYLVSGVTRWRRYLDFLIRSVYRGKLKNIEPRLKQIIRIGVYECFVLDHSRPKVINGVVGLAMRTVRPNAGRLVNALLRTMSRSPLPVPDTGNKVEDLAIRLSHPTWMVERWWDRFGPASTEKLLTHNNAVPWFGIRCNPLKESVNSLKEWLTNQEVEWEDGLYLNDFLRVRRVAPITRSGLISSGRCAVQDEAAGLVVRLLDPQPGETVLDVCSAPGGKGTYSAIRMKNTGRIVAVDYHDGKMRRLEESAQAGDLTIIEPRVADVATMDPVPASKVLLDVPCTGTGVLAKRADMRWRRLSQELRRIVRVQDMLMNAAARSVIPGGVLVYSTCSIEPEENEERVAAFLSRHPSFVLEEAGPRIPKELVSKEGYLRSLPQDHRIDGTFAARMFRRVPEL